MIYRDPQDHPVVQNLERTGYPDGREPRWPRCPICGSECDTVFKDKFGAIVGCEECVDPCDAWEEDECR